MTNEQVIGVLKSLLSYYNDPNEEDCYVGFDKDDNEAIDLAIKALEQQPCDDAVSRQALIDKATSWNAHFTDSEKAVSLTDIMSLPSVTPQRPKGHWIPVHPLQADDDGAYICSCCKVGNWGADPAIDKYCFNCGARMNGGEEDGSYN